MRIMAPLRVVTMHGDTQTRPLGLTRHPPALPSCAGSH